MCEVARIASRKPMPRRALTTWDGKHLHDSAANRHGIDGETESSVNFQKGESGDSNAFDERVNDASL